MEKNNMQITEKDKERIARAEFLIMAANSDEALHNAKLIHLDIMELIAEKNDLEESLFSEGYCTV